MKTTTRILALLIATAAGAAIAAEATNPAAKARQETMDTMAGAAKVLGGMAKGEVAFDAAAAAAAKETMATAAATITEVFKANETDPKSKAKPEIWENWADFEAKAGDLVKAIDAMDTSSQETVGAGMGAVGGACGACHKVYQAS